MPRLCVIDLAGTPQGKGRGRAAVVNGRAHVFTPAKTRSYEAQLRYAGEQAMAGRPPSDAPIRLTMTVCLAVPQSWSKKKRAQALSGRVWPTVKPDADNSLKLTDALNGICFVDDKQIVIVSLMKVYSERPGLFIEVDTLEPASFLRETVQERGDRLAYEALKAGSAVNYVNQRSLDAIGSTMEISSTHRFPDSSATDRRCARCGKSEASMNQGAPCVVTLDVPR